jgi:hypothetical protein
MSMSHSGRIACALRGLFCASVGAGAIVVIVQAGYCIQNHRGLFLHFNKAPDSQQKALQVSVALSKLSG